MLVMIRMFVFQFMGVYDYRPDKQADHYSKYELAFRAGDIIAVYGGQRPDGYYHGEVSWGNSFK